MQEVWLEQCPNADLTIAVWAAMGHHLKIGLDRNNQPAEFIAEILPGTGDELTIYTHHHDFQAVLDMGRKSLRLPDDLPDPPQETWSKAELQEALRCLRDEFIQFESQLNWEQQKFIAAVKATVIAADLAGSALPLVEEDFKEWIQQVLALNLSKDEVQKLVEQRLEGKPLRPFQEQIAKTHRRVTLVKAGCGTGKTIGAYGWAGQWAVNRRLFFCYPTTGTASQGYIDYADGTEIEATLMHSRADLDRELLFSGDSDDSEGIDARLTAFSAWRKKLIVCTVDSVLGLIQNNRKPLYSWAAIAQSAFVFDEVHAYDERLFGALLQHNSTHKSAGTQTKSLQLEEDKKEIIITYKALQSYAYQDFASNLCDKQGKFLTKPISVAGWLNPGAVVRHIAFNSDTSFKEPAAQALILLFAPVACYYYILRSKLRDKRAQYALVIPEVIDLEKYAQYRQNPHLKNASYKDFHASGLGDAGLRFLTYEITTEIASTFKVPRCQVLTLGTVAWASQQKTRTDLYVIEANAQICHNYRVCDDWLADRTIEGKNGGFVASSFARELISENLARNRNQPWYSGFSEKVNSNELFKKLAYERGGLYQVIQKIDSDEREKLFIIACHEAIKFTYGKISDQAKKRREIPNFDRETVRIRTGIGRCKNAHTFREFITDFWSRAGRIPTLQEHWQDLMELVMDDKQWKKARDLSLLALASYKGKGVSDSDEDVEDESGEDNLLIDVEID